MRAVPYSVAGPGVTRQSGHQVVTGRSRWRPVEEEKGSIRGPGAQRLKKSLSSRSISELISVHQWWRALPTLESARLGSNCCKEFCEEMERISKF